MIETTKEWEIETKEPRDELKEQLNSAILKLFFKKNMNESKEWRENREQEVNFNIQWSIKWPDKFWNYIMSYDGKKILVDEKLNDITWLEFVWLMPYNDRYYVCDLWKKCVFFDTQTWNTIEFAETWKACRPKVYWKDELCDDEFMIDLCGKSIKHFENENQKTLTVWFYWFLVKYYKNILWKNIDVTEKMSETSEFGKQVNSIFSFLMWTYEYMYNWRITNFLAWKDVTLREELKESDLLKTTFPDLYLGMHELDFVKNVLIDKNWNVCGYVIVQHWICYYVQLDWTMTKYDDFIWPDKYWNIITRQWNKKYFINSNFKYPFCGFDEIHWPDKNWNFVLKFKNKRCFVPINTWMIFGISDQESTWNEPNFTTECFDIIQWPDENNNYKIKCSKWYFLLNWKWEKISDIFLSLDFIPETRNYKALNMSRSAILDKDWKILK